MFQMIFYLFAVNSNQSCSTETINTKAIVSNI